MNLSGLVVVVNSGLVVVVNSLYESKTLLYKESTESRSSMIPGVNYVDLALVILWGRTIHRLPRRVVQGGVNVSGIGFGVLCQSFKSLLHTGWDLRNVCNRQCSFGHLPYGQYK